MNVHIAQQQSQELAQKLWAIANDLRGQMDASRFKDYILGVIFYRYLSERTERYMNDLLVDDKISYREALKDSNLAPVVRKYSLDHLGYIIEPEYLFASLINEINGKEFSIDHLDKAISKLTESTLGQKSEAAFEKLFDDMDLTNKDLGREVSERTEKMSKIMLKIADIQFDTENSEIDILGTAYMILIGLFQSEAGKKGGEFFTPVCASKLLTRLVTIGLNEIRYACDPCAGSGSLLLQVKEHLTNHKIGHYYGQEYNGSTFNLLRMNLLMHGVLHHQFTVYNGDTLKHDNFYENGKPIYFDIQVTNPPFSSHWMPGTEENEDPRYSAAGAMAPNSYADLAFLEHMVYHMAEDGRIGIVLPHGVLFRGGKELTIRKYLINKLNCIDAIIGLPANMFHGTSIPACIVILKKKRNGNSNNILFIDASKDFIKGKNQNSISDEHIDKIVNAYIERKDIEKYAHVASLDEIKKKDFNLNIPRYVDTFEKEEEIDIKGVAEELNTINDDIAKETSLFQESLKNLVSENDEVMAGIKMLINVLGENE